MLDQLQISQDDKNLFGLEGKIKDTAIEAYTDNAPKLFIDSTQGIFLESSNAFMGALKLFADQSGRNLSDFDTETVNLIIDHLYASIYMGIDGATKSELKNIFYGDNSVANQLWKYKHGKNKLKDVAIVDFLMPTKSRENSLGYIKGNTSSIKDSGINDKLINSWSGRTEEFFTKLLPRYALYSTAWRTNLFSFHELTPQTSALSNKINEEFKKLKNPTDMVEKNILGLDNSEYFGDVVNQIYRHLHHNKILVPNARKNDIISKSKVKDKASRITTQFKTESNKFILDDSTIELGARYKPFLTFEDNLYKFIGNDKQNNNIGIYELTYKLGLRDNNNHYIYEYSKSERGSFIEENNVNSILSKQEEEGFELLEGEEDIETFEGEIYDSNEEDNLETSIEC